MNMNATHISEIFKIFNYIFIIFGKSYPFTVYKYFDEIIFITIINIKIF